MIKLFTVPSQCVTARTLSKDRSLMSVATKIAIQMNCKLGGAPWALSIPVSICILPRAVCARGYASVFCLLVPVTCNCLYRFLTLSFQNNKIDK